jgi:hypothetical protein
MDAQKARHFEDLCIERRVSARCFVLSKELIRQFVKRLVSKYREYVPRHNNICGERGLRRWCDSLYCAADVVAK